MALEDDPIEVVDFAFLKFGAAPNRCEGRQVILVSPIFRSQPDDDWAVLQFHRVEMINRFEMAKALCLLHLFDFLFNAVSNLLDLHLLGNLGIKPVHAGDIGAVIKANFRSVTQKPRDRQRVRVVHQQRALRTRAVVADDLEARARNGGFDAGFNSV